MLNHPTCQSEYKWPTQQHQASCSDLPDDGEVATTLTSCCSSRMLLLTHDALSTTGSILNAMVVLNFLFFTPVFLCLLFEKTARTEITTRVGTSMIYLCSNKSSLLSSTLYVTHVINYSRPSPSFPNCNDRKLGGTWEQGYRSGRTRSLMSFMNDIR